MTATDIQENIEALQGKVREFNEQLLKLHADCEAKRQEAGAAMLEGAGDTSDLEGDIARLESKIKTVELGKSMAEKKLPELMNTLSEAKKNDGQERMTQIRKEMDRVGEELENDLLKALKDAKVFDGLISEAWSLYHGLNVSLGGLGAWWRLGDLGYLPMSSKVQSVLGRLIENKPKNL